MHRPAEPISPPYDYPADIPTSATTTTSVAFGSTPASAPAYGELSATYPAVGGQLTPASSTSSLPGAHGRTDASPRGEYFPHAPSHPMNHHSSYLSQSPTHISNPPSYATQAATAGEMSHFSQYSPATSMPSAGGSYGHPGYSYYNTVTSPQSATQPPSASSQLAPLPLGVGMNAGHHGAYGMPSAHPSSGYHPQPTPAQQQPPPPPQHFDSTGQIPPPGVKPRVTATLWEDEGSLCFQVEAKGVCVARREDNHFINGTKLLNVAGMTRGRRDGILKSEKTRHVVKIGPMHLKGVWIPYERALDFANREKITELLYPLFVHNISALLYHPTNPQRPGSSMDANRRKDSQRPLPTTLGGTSSGPPAAGLHHHHHSMNGQMPSQQHGGAQRPEMNRAHTFPTPPTSASAIVPPQHNSYDWGNQNLSGGVSSSQPLTIETSLGNTRSMPSTPATTPPANSLQSMPSYGTNSYSAGGTYATTPHTPNQYTTQQQQNMARFGQAISSHGYVKSEMGPPSRGTATADGDPNGTDAVNHHHQPYHNAHGDDEGEHGGEHTGRYGTSSGSFSYTPTSTIGTMGGDQSSLTGEAVEHSPAPGSDRVPPRTSVTQGTWNSGYNTPPRSGTSSMGYGVGDTRGSGSSLINGHVSAGPYDGGYGLGGSHKRGRDDDDEYAKHSLNGGAEAYDVKRHKSHREGSLSGPPVGGYDYTRPHSTILQGATR